jgi:hypothetical protein
VRTNALPSNSSGEKRGSFNKEVGISISIKSVWDLIVFLESGVEPSGSRIVQRLGVWDQNVAQTLQQLVF